MSIYEQVTRRLRELTRQGSAPYRISFSDEGYRLAISQRDGYGNFGGHDDVRRPTTYLGLPFCIAPGQAVEVDVEVDTSPAQAQPISFRVDHLNPAQTTMEIVGQALTRAQLSDVITAWVAAHQDEPGVGGLADWVRTHGRFE